MQSTKILAGLLIVTSMFFASCRDNNVLGPDNDNHLTPGNLKDPQYGEGLLLNGYAGWPNQYSLNEVATDDAVTNDKISPYLRMATGEWSALYNPVSVWDNSYRALYYVNYFLGIIRNIDYAWDDRSAPSAERDSMFVKRFTGEAKVLRAWHNFELLKNHGGVANDGTAKGFILLREGISTDTHMARSSYDDCVKFILDDINTGIANLPNVYADQTPANTPTLINYNKVFGNSSNKNKGRIDGKFAKALKSRVLLHVASMPFYTAPAKWDSAAVAAGKLLTIAGGGINGVNALSGNGITFWTRDADAEILFRRDYGNSNAREVDNYPPGTTFYGNGKTNPSQNLVDAFPMANGYPINDPASGYNAANPYAGRDPRLKAYIIYNGNDLNNRVVKTNVEDAQTGLNTSLTATRTGYYLKKLLRPELNISPSTNGTGRAFYTVFRYTEIFLNYAEAANEAWGPDADPKNFGFTPRTIIAKIRQRAGIPAADPYLAAQTSQDQMRQLIRNERRLELCFEGFRFWDMRRWNLNLGQAVKGMNISGTTPTYTVFDVESRGYQPFMNYGPIPYQEVLKDNLLLQNTGW